MMRADVKEVEDGGGGRADAVAVGVEADDDDDGDGVMRGYVSSNPSESPLLQPTAPPPSHPTLPQSPLSTPSSPSVPQLLHPLPPADELEAAAVDHPSSLSTTDTTNSPFPALEEASVGDQDLSSTPPRSPAHSEVEPEPEPEPTVTAVPPLTLALPAPVEDSGAGVGAQALEADDELEQEHQQLLSPVDPHRLYLVEEILDKRGVRQKAEYLVRWLGQKSPQWVRYSVVQAVEFKIWNKFNVAYKKRMQQRERLRVQQLQQPPPPPKLSAPAAPTTASAAEPSTAASTPTGDGDMS